MWKQEEVTLTPEQEEQYKKYQEEWQYRKNCNRNGFVDWGISSGNGDPYNKREWLRRPSLHNFEGTNY